MLKPETAQRKDLTAGIGDMQHRHFATIATIIREMKPDVYGPEEVAQEFAERLRATNPKFDRARFLLACGVES